MKNQKTNVMDFLKKKCEKYQSGHLSLFTIDLVTLIKKKMICSTGASYIYNQKSHFLQVGPGTTTTYSPSNTKFPLKYFNVS